VKPIDTQTIADGSVASAAARGISVELAARSGAAVSAGRLIVNADDWGRSEETTDRTWECVRCGAVSSVSAMTYMPDSERAAAMARERGVDAGLHLNLTSQFLAADCPSRLAEQQRRVAKYLNGSPFARGIYNPFLARAFQYVVAAQIEEYARLYGTEPARIDGHHHMHLSANVLLGGFLPKGKILRRHFSHEAHEKAMRHRVFRWFTDLRLAGRFRVTDFFFPLIPLEPAERLRRVFALAARSTVEVETHPVNPAEYEFLTGGELFRLAEKIPVARGYALNASARALSSIP